MRLGGESLDATLGVVVLSLIGLSGICFRDSFLGVWSQLTWNPFLDPVLGLVGFSLNSTGSWSEA